MAITEKDIVLCGHGSNKPSIKNMYDYLESRYKQIASNGKRKQIVCVRRLKGMDAVSEQKFHDTYAIILGRNIYKQSLRQYVFAPYIDDQYYSDCSSSGCATYKRIGNNIPLLNTAGIYSSTLFEDVHVIFKDGHVTNPEILHVGDALLFVGNDPKRPLQIGHVEFVFDIKKDYTQKQFVKDVQKAIGASVDGIAGMETLGKTVTVSQSTNNRHAVVQHIQRWLNANGFNCGTVDGVAGEKFDAAVKAYQQANGCFVDGEITAKKKTWQKLLGMV